MPRSDPAANVLLAASDLLRPRLPRVLAAIALGVLIGTAAYRSTHAGARLITRAVRG